MTTIDIRLSTPVTAGERSGGIAAADHLALAKVLVATNGQPTSDGAVRVALDLARRAGTTVEVVTVFEPAVPLPRLEGVAHRQCERDDRREVARLLLAVRRQLQRFAAVREHWPVRFDVGHVPTILARTAREADADALILGLGRSDPAHRSIGSETALRLLLIDDVPVLAVPAAAETVPRHALALIDPADPGASAAWMAMRVLRGGGTLELVVVMPKGPSWLRAGSVDDARMSEEIIESLERSPELPGDVVLRRRVVYGDPAHALAELANRVHADLIAVPLFGRSCAERTLMHGPAIPLLRMARCGVLIAPTERSEELQEFVRARNDVRSRVTPPGAVARS